MRRFSDLSHYEQSLLLLRAVQLMEAGNDYKTIREIADQRSVCPLTLWLRICDGEGLDGCEPWEHYPELPLDLPSHHGIQVCKQSRTDESLGSSSIKSEQTRDLEDHKLPVMSHHYVQMLESALNNETRSGIAHLASLGQRCSEFRKSFFSVLDSFGCRLSVWVAATLRSGKGFYIQANLMSVLLLGTGHRIVRQLVSLAARQGLAALKAVQLELPKLAEDIVGRREQPAWNWRRIVAAATAAAERTCQRVVDRADRGVTWAYHLAQIQGAALTPGRAE